MPEKMRAEYSAPPPFDECIFMPVACIVSEAAKELDSLAVYDEEKVCKIAAVLYGRLIARSSIGLSPRPAHCLAKLLHGKVTERTLQNWIDGDSVNLDLLAKNGLVDDLVSMLGIDQPLRAKAARCLLGIPFCTDKNPMHELMDYARRHPHDVGPREVICIAKRMRRKGVVEYREELGLRAALWQHLWGKAGKTQRRRMRSVEEIGRKIGCSSDEDLATWRQLVVGIPRTCTQEALNECFFPTGRPGYRINTRANHQRERAAEFRTFLHHLCQRHGVQNPIDLARCILERSTTHISSSQLANGIKYLSSSASNHNRLLPEQADLVARFAFPDDLSLQDKCRQFLASEEYLRQPEAKAAAISVARLRSKQHKEANRDRS